LAVLALLVAPASGLGSVIAGGSVIDEAADALQESSVYISPDAAPQARLTRPQETALEARIERTGDPIYVAILPPNAEDDAGGSMRELTQAVYDATGRRDGTYVVVAGDRGRTLFADTSVRGVPAGEIAQQALAEGGGLPAVLTEIVDDVAVAQAGGRATPNSRSGRDSGGSGTGGSSLFGLLLPVALVVGGIMLFRSRRRRKREIEGQHRDFEEVRQVAREDVLALGSDVYSLDAAANMPNADPRAVEDYRVAVRQFERASALMERADRAEDLEPVTSAIEEGRYAMTAARARLEGREPPERRPPCFFDPRHGPSVDQVEWAPEGGAPRPVPVCSECEWKLEHGEQPNARELEVAGQRVPYWEAPAQYGPWAGGYQRGFGGGFGGGFAGGGLFTGLLLGQMLGGMFGGMHHDGGHESGGFGGGGDFGGGDFGGGGGGDFGGGGGDFGGGGGGGDF
jgi:hypothetical protein